MKTGRRHAHDRKEGRPCGTATRERKKWCNMNAKEQSLVILRVDSVHIMSG